MTAGGAAAIPWYLAYRASKPPTVSLWPVFVFAAVALVGVCFLVAGHAGLPPAMPAIEPDHAASLRAAARRVDVLSQGGAESPFGDEFERREFTAHYRRAQPSVGDVLRTAAAEDAAWQQVRQTVSAAASARFPSTAYWHAQNIAARTLERLRDQGYEVKLRYDEFQITEPMVEGHRVARDIVWDNAVV